MSSEHVYEKVKEDRYPSLIPYVLCVRTDVLIFSIKR